MKVKTALWSQTIGQPEQLPRPGLPEVAFAGRSNVGKSSLINALLNRKDLARTSATPGKTQCLFYYIINDQIYFVDLPGYGYAQVSRAKREYFKVLVDRYFERQPGVPALCVLILDPKRPVEETELDFLRYLEVHSIRPQVVFTKWDRVRASDRSKMQKDRLEELQGCGGSKPLFLSSRTGAGLDQLWRVIDVTCTPPTSGEENAQ